MIITAIKLYLAKRHLAKKKAKFKAGFEWGMSAYYVEGKSIENIETYLYSPFLSAKEDSFFDKGVERAMRLIKEIEEAGVIK